MTDDDRDREIGRAYRESQKLNQGIEGLKEKINDTGRALYTLASDPGDAESLTVLKGVRNPLEDFEELQRMLKRLEELNRILRYPNDPTAL